MKRVFYHGTSQENYQKILEEGVLWGLPREHTPVSAKLTDVWRHTYLSECLNVAQGYAEGGVLLKVLYDPAEKNQIQTNFEDVQLPAGWCHWQFLVWEPIPISDVSVLDTQGHPCWKCANKHRNCYWKSYFLKKAIANSHFRGRI